MAELRNLFRFPSRCRRGEGHSGERANGEHVRKRMRARVRWFLGIPERGASGRDAGTQESSDASEFRHLELVGRASKHRESSDGPTVATTFRRGLSALETVS